MRVRSMLVSAMVISMAGGLIAANAQVSRLDTAPSDARPPTSGGVPAGITPADPSHIDFGATTIDPLRLSVVLQHFAQDAFDMLQTPITADVDMSLSYKMMSFYHIQIDMAQALLRYSTDPELRRGATRDIEIAADRISTLRNWQVSRQILQQQITGQLPLTPLSLSGGKENLPLSTTPLQRAPAPQ